MRNPSQDIREVDSELTWGFVTMAIEVLDGSGKCCIEGTQSTPRISRCFYGCER